MEQKTAILAGGSGLIGGQLLDLLLNSEYYREVRVLTRSPIPKSHPKLINEVVDFEKLRDYNLKADGVFCCLGTTMKQAGSREAFRKVDFEYPVSLARLSAKAGARQFLIVTAMGSNSSSRFFYNRVKAETEDAVSAVGFPIVHIFRPSLLVGPRRNRRFGETMGYVGMWLFTWITPKRFRAIQSIRVARAMLFYATREEEGIFFHPSDILQSFTR